ncbi:MAG: helix-turn-helix domain-containing protein, partial [Planctomycetales bacterium]
KQDSHWRIVRTAEEFAHASLDRPIVLSDLCSLTDVSERTLRSAFLNVVGLTPNKYLRIIRLNRVRAELQRSSPGLTSVTSAAMRWGFYHLGRFSQDYKRLFGESPSETVSEVAKIEPSA